MISIDFFFHNRKRTAHSITQVYYIWMNIIVISKAVDLFSSMKIKSIIGQLTRQSNRKKDVLAYLHQARKIYIISKKLLRVQGEIWWLNFKLNNSNNWTAIFYFDFIQICNDHIIHVQSWICHHRSRWTDKSWP